jgi:hypothetical protein
LVLAVVALSPSLVEMATQGLSPETVLARLAMALLLIGGLVWLVSGVVVHYARVQAGRHVEADQPGEMG